MYDPTDLWPLTGTIEGRANAWIYVNNEDSIATITSAGFLATGGEAGMQVGDIVWVLSKVAPSAILCQVTAVNTGGALNHPTSATITREPTTAGVNTVSSGTTAITVTPTTGNAVVSFPSQAANVILSGPTSGGAVAPAFRALVSADVPPINLASNAAGGVTGNLPVTHLASGTSASASTFWRGDGTWSTPAGSGNVNNVGTPTTGQIGIWTGATTLSGVTNLPVTNLNSGTGATSSTFWRGDGTWASAAGPSGNAFTSANDTNVTLALSGTPASALLASVLITAGWTGSLSVSRGGIGAVTLTPNGVLYGNGTSAVQALAINATATNKFLTQVSSGAPAWNTIATSDVPAINLAASGAGGVTGNLAVSHLNSGTSASASTFWRGDGTWSTPAGAGTVTSVALTAPGFLSVGGSPITSSGTLALSLAAQAQNTVLAAPSSGSGAPTFRALVASDIPGGGGGSGGAIDLRAVYGLVADGYKVIGSSDPPTDNGPAFLNMLGAGLPTIPSLKTINPDYGPPIPVVCSTSTGTITTYTDSGRGTPTTHALRVSDPFILIAPGGTLPSNYTPGTIFYAMTSGMAANSFNASTTDEFAWFCITDINGAGLPSPIVWTGSPTGVFMCTVNADWLEVELPPGPYYATSLFRIAGPRKLRLNAYGAVIVGAANINVGFSGVSFVHGFFPQRGFPINSVSAGSTSVTFQNASDTDNFTVGGWLMLGMDEKQSHFGSAQGAPSNMYEFEYLPIQSISGAVVTLGTTYGPSALAYTKNGYLDTMPTVLPNGAAGALPLTGSALAYACAPAWDMDLEVYGLRNTAAGQFQISGRNISYIDGISDAGASGGPVPTLAKCVIIDNARVGTGVNSRTAIICDKLVEQLIIRNQEQITSIQIEGSGPDLLTLENCNIQQLSGTGNQTVIGPNCAIPLGVLVGPAFGSTDTLTIIGSRLGNFQAASRLDDSPTSGSFGTALHNWSNTDGVISQPFVNTTANSWMSLGKSAFINDMAQAYAYMGAPFKINNIYLTYDNGAGSTVTVSAATPAVVTWTGSPTVVNDDIVSFSDLLPTGGQLLPFTPYWVVNVAGTTTKTFNLAAFLNGPPIATTGSLTSPTLYRNPKYNAETTLASFPAGSSTTVNVTITQASAPSALIVTGSAPVANGTRVAFTTTGVLPAIGAVQATGNSTCTISGNLMTVAGVTGVDFIQAGQTVVGSGITPGTVVMGFQTLSSGYNGTWYVSKSQSFGPGVLTFFATLSTSVLYYTQGTSGNTYNISTDSVTALNGVAGASAAGTGTHTAITSPLKFAPHPCPSVTVIGSTGHAYIEDARNAPRQGVPMFSYGSRTMTGQISSTPGALATQIKVHGKLKQMIINVDQADTSGGGAATLYIGRQNATFTGTVGSPTTHLTVTGVTGVLLPGDIVVGTHVTAGTTIVSQVSGFPGAAGEYVLSAANTASADSYISYGTIGFNSTTLAPLDFSGIIDLKTTGIRVITNASGTTTGSAGADVFAAYAGTIGENVDFVMNVAAGSQPSNKYAHVFVSVETDQGIFTVPSVGYYNDVNWPNTVTQIDTTSPGTGTTTGV